MCHNWLVLFCLVLHYLIFLTNRILLDSFSFAIFIFF
jgi:hypothetical protein